MFRLEKTLDVSERSFRLHVSYKRNFESCLKTQTTDEIKIKCTTYAPYFNCFILSSCIPLYRLFRAKLRRVWGRYTSSLLGLSSSFMLPHRSIRVTEEPKAYDRFMELLNVHTPLRSLIDSLAPTLSSIIVTTRFSPATSHALRGTAEKCESMMYISSLMTIEQLIAILRKSDIIRD